MFLKNWIFFFFNNFVKTLETFFFGGGGGGKVGGGLIPLPLPPPPSLAFAHLQQPPDEYLCHTYLCNLSDKSSFCPTVKFKKVN